MGQAKKNKCPKCKGRGWVLLTKGPWKGCHSLCRLCKGKGGSVKSPEERKTGICL